LTILIITFYIITARFIINKVREFKLLILK